MFTMKTTGLGAAQRRVQQVRQKLKNPAGLKGRLTGGLARFYRGVPIPQDNGDLARAYRQPEGPGSETSFETTPSGWEFNRTITVPHAPYQAHRIRKVPPRVVREAAYDHLTEGQEP